MYEENYGKRRAYYERRKKRRRKIIARRFLCTALVAACIVGTGIGIKRLFTRSGGTAAFRAGGAERCRAGDSDRGRGISPGG